jgi:hypothetical protein
VLTADCEVFFLAVQEGRLKDVRRMADRAPDLVNERRQGTTPLHLAAAANDLPMAALLVRRGADCNALDEPDGISPAALAGKKGHHEMQRYLSSYMWGDQGQNAYERFMERFVLEGYVDEFLGYRKGGIWGFVKILLLMLRYLILGPFLLMCLLFCLLFWLIPTLVVCWLPLVTTCLVWLGGIFLGGFLGQVLGGTEGLLIGSVAGAGVFSGLYAGFVSRKVPGFLGAGAGWRYWKTIHQAGMPETQLPVTPEEDSLLGHSPTLIEILLDMAAACCLAAAAAVAGGVLGGLLAGLLAFGFWGVAWGVSMGATYPRGPRYGMDIAGICPANYFCALLCPMGTPFQGNSIRWALGCGIGYAIQVLPVGILSGVLGAEILARWR